MVRKSGYIGKGGVNVIFARTESAQEKFENSQNIAHLPRNMRKRRSTRISHALVLCASFRETMQCQSVTKYLLRKLVQRTNTWINRVEFFYTYSRVNGLCFGYFQIFPERSPFNQKMR